MDYLPKVAEPAFRDVSILGIDEPVLGGFDGVDNRPHRELAERDEFLLAKAKGQDELIKLLRAQVDSLNLKSSSAVRTAVLLNWLYGDASPSFELWGAGFSWRDIAPIAITGTTAGDDTVDRDDVVGLRQVWNGGQIGIADTKAVLAKAKAVIRTLPAQAKLAALRYPVGKVDGDQGDRTTGAVQLLQRREGLPVTGVLDDATVAALDTAAPLAVPAKDADLTRSRTIQGSGVAGTLGLGEVMRSADELKNQLTDAEAHISAGTVLGLVVGALIVAGAAYAIYARWDDAGRPVPGFLARCFPGLAGGAA